MKPRTVNKIATSLIVFFALLIVAILVGLLGYILFRGLSHISWDFLFSAPQKLSRWRNWPSAIQLLIPFGTHANNYSTSRTGCRYLHG